MAMLALGSKKSHSKGSSGRPPEDPLPQDDGPSPLIFEIAADPTRYPFLEFGAVEVNNYPTPGTFHQALEQATFVADGEGQFPGHHIAYQALHSAGRIAEALGLLSPGQDARTFASNREMQVAYATLIICSPFNDKLYSQANGTTAPGWVKGPAGRTIAFHSRHSDALGRLNSGLPLVRTINSSTGQRGGNVGAQVDASWTPLLWLPAINLKKMTEGEITTLDVRHADGSSSIIPHPDIMAVLEESPNIPPYEGCP